MKIATYNIGDSYMGMPIRFRQLTDEISRIKAAIICRQDIWDDEKHHIFSKLCGYDYKHYVTKNA